MTDRDHFAAAALTGLLARPDIDDDPLEFGLLIDHAYKWADAMLRERGNHPAKPDSSTNLDAAPAARAAISESYECPPNVRCQQTGESRCAASGSCSGTGKQPAPPCVETDGFSPGSRTGQINRTPERESPRRECGETLLRDVPQLDNSRAAGGPEPLFTSGGADRPVSYAESDENRVLYDTKRCATPPRNGALSGCETVPDPDSRVLETPRTPQPHTTPPQGTVQGEGSFRDSRNAKYPVAWANFYPDEEMVDFQRDTVEQCSDEGEVVPLYRSPTLTDAEREAVKTAMNAYGSDNANPECAAIEATLWGLLERMGGGR